MKASQMMLFAALVAACDPEGAAAMNPEETPVVAPSLELNEVKSGTTFNIGPRCRAGVSTVDRASVVVSVWLSDELNDPAIESRQDVRWGQLLVACGGLYRASTFKSDGYAVFEKNPVPPPPGLSFRPDSLVLALGGQGSVTTRPAKVRDFLAKVRDISAEPGGASAILDLELHVSGEGPGAQIRKETVKLKVGDAIAAAKGKYKVLSIVPPAPQQGIPGWVEIDPRPL